MNTQINLTEVFEDCKQIREFPQYSEIDRLILNDYESALPSIMKEDSHLENATNYVYGNELISICKDQEEAKQRQYEIITKL